MHLYHTALKKARNGTFDFIVKHAANDKARKRRKFHDTLGNTIVFLGDSQSWEKVKKTFISSWAENTAAGILNL